MTSIRNEKSGDNDNPQIVPITFVSAPLDHSGDHQHQQYTYHEEQQIAPDMIQVVTIDGPNGSQPRQRAPSPLVSRQQQVQPLLPPSELDPSAIYVVTFDEPSDFNIPDHPQPHPHQQQSVQEEATPLLYDNDRSQEETADHRDAYIHESEEDDSGGSARCRDIPWAVLFWLHLAFVFYLGFRVSPKGYEMMDEMDFNIHKIHDFLQQNAVNDDDFTETDLEMLTQFLEDFQSWWAVYPPRILWFALIMILFAFGLNIVKLMILRFMVLIVASSLLLPVAALGAIIVLGLVHYPSFWFFLMGSLIIGLFVVFIRKTLWPKIHFASINLQIALHGIGHNLGTYVWVFWCATLTLLWVLFWCYTTVGLVNYMDATYCPMDQQDWEDGNRYLASNNHTNGFDDPPSSCGPSTAAILALMVSFYWTCSFIGNTAQVYVAGVMATWCFDKDTAEGCCSTAVTSSLYRSLTFSSGPIAFGSLLQGVCKTIRSLLSHSNRSHTRNQYVVHDSGDDCRCCCFGLVGLVLDCLSELFGDVLNYFSEWAYVFVGIYGNSYLESGKAVMDLFRSRGWITLITDRLVVWVLAVGVFVNGVVTGLAAILVERLITSMMYGKDDVELPPSYVFGPPPNIGFTSFLVGFVVGCVVSSIFMSVVYGAVNTLIVCWAESPTTFMENHKDWADQIVAVWSSAYPGTQIQPRHDSVSTSATSTTLSPQAPGQSSTTYGATNNAAQ